MAERIGAAPVRYPFSFVVAGDSGAWPDPTADAIFAQLLRQAAATDPVFFANLGDFAGPGTRERHADYLGHEFAHGHTRFVAIDAAPGEVGEIDIEETNGPGDEALCFLDERLIAAAEPHSVVLMHCPPAFDGRFEPQPEWGFADEERFLEIVRRHQVDLVCCAHALLFDQHVRDGTRFVVTGGGGTGLCSHFRGICTPGDGRPEDRGALFHAVEIVVQEDGAMTGRVHQAFGGVRIEF